MEKKNLRKISLQPLPNGYALSVDGIECMYFNEVDLVAGFLAHVGLGETGYMDKGTILSTLFSAMMGQAYADSVTTLKNRVGLLTSQYQTTIDRMDKAIEYVSQAENTISGMLKRIEKIELSLKATEQDHAQNKKTVEDATRKLYEIERRSNEVMNSLSNSATIMKGIEEAAKAAKGKKKAEDEDGGSPSKSDSGDQESATKDKKPSGKSKGGRKKNDEAVLKEIEKQAKENPNIK